MLYRPELTAHQTLMICDRGRSTEQLYPSIASSALPVDGGPIDPPDLLGNPVLGPEIGHRLAAGAQGVIVDDHESMSGYSRVKIPQRIHGRFIHVAIQPQHGY